MTCLQADAHTNCGLLLQRSGRLADALVHAREATRLAPRVPNVWLNLAGLLLFCGEMQEALECAKKCVGVEMCVRGGKEVCWRGHMCERGAKRCVGVEICMREGGGRVGGVRGKGQRMCIATPR